MMKNTNNSFLLRIAFAMLFAFLIPDLAWAYGPALQPGTVFDGITSTFQNSSAGWMSAAQGYAQNLFLSLAAIEFTWAAIQLTMKKGELQDMVASTMMKVVGIGFFYSMLMVAPTWIPAIMDSFGMAGAAVGANGGSKAMLSPSGIFDQGINVASSMVSAMNSSNTNNLGLGQIVSSGGASLGSFMFGAIVTGLAGLITILAFTLVAIQLMVTLIESYIVIGGGMLMLGFTGSRWTLPFGEKYFGYAVSTGIKLFTLYLIVGQGQNVADAIVHGLTSGGAAPGPVDFMGAGASSLAYGAMGYMVPSMAGSMMNGSPALSMGNMAAAGGGLAGSMVGAAAMAAGTALSGVSAASGMFNKTSKAAGNIGGDALTAAGGSIGGGLPGGGSSPSGSPGSGGGGNAGGFGGGSESSVAAPPGMGGANSGGGSSAQPVPAPAAAAEMSASAASPAMDRQPMDKSIENQSERINKADPMDKIAAADKRSNSASAPASGGSESPVAAASSGSSSASDASASPAMDAPIGGAPASAASSAPSVGAPPAASSGSAAAVDTAPAGSASPAMSIGNQPVVESGSAPTTPAQGEVSKQSGENQDAAAKASTSGKAAGPAASVNVTPSANVSANVSAKGGTDAAVSVKKKGFDLDKTAQGLQEMARRMDRLPVNDGHAGGISIRLNHID